MTFSLKATACFVPSALSETYKTAPLNENIKKKSRRWNSFPTAASLHNAVCCNETWDCILRDQDLYVPLNEVQWNALRLRKIKMLIEILTDLKKSRNSHILYTNISIYRRLKSRNSVCYGGRGSIVVRARGYKPEGRWFETRWNEWISSIYLILPAALVSGGS
jgi:hypothetical protein